MQRGTGRRSPSQNEMPEGRQLGIEPVNQPFKPRDVIIAERGLRAGETTFPLGSASWAPRAKRSR